MCGVLTQHTPIVLHIKKEVVLCMSGTFSLPYVLHVCICVCMCMYVCMSVVYSGYMTLIGVHEVHG